jgi:hypothetical protein
MNKFKIWFLNNWLNMLYIVAGLMAIFWIVSILENRGYNRWHRDIEIAQDACKEISAEVGLREKTLWTGQRQWKVVCIYEKQ